MNKKYVLSLVLLLGVAQGAWGMEEHDAKAIIQESSNTEINIECNEMQQKVEVKTLYSALGESLTTVGLKVIRKAQKTTGFVNVAQETKEEQEQLLHNFGSITNISELSLDAKQGGLFSNKPSYFKQVNDRVHSNNAQAHLTLVNMSDTNSLDVNKLKIAKQYIDNGEAYSTAMRTLLLNAYNEKLQEIQSSIEQGVQKEVNGKQEIQEEKK